MECVLSPLQGGGERAAPLPARVGPVRAEPSSVLCVSPSSSAQLGSQQQLARKDSDDEEELGEGSAPTLLLLDTEITSRSQEFRETESPDSGVPSWSRKVRINGVSQHAVDVAVY